MPRALPPLASPLTLLRDALALSVLLSGLLRGFARAIRGESYRHFEWTSVQFWTFAPIRLMMHAFAEYVKERDGKAGFASLARIVAMQALPGYLHAFLVQMSRRGVVLGKNGPLVLCDVWSRAGNAPSLDAMNTLDVVIVYVHGGAFCLGSRWDAAPNCRVLLDAVQHELPSAKAACVCIEYTLAADSPFPTALNEVTSVLEDLSARNVRMVLVGDSAGGGLVVSSLLSMSKNGQCSTPTCIKGAFLLSPMSCVDASFAYNDEGNVITTGFLHQASLVYCPDQTVAKNDFLASPATSKSTCLKGLPPLLLHGGEIDIFKPLNARLVQLAERDGVKCVFREFEGMPHGFQTMLPGASQSIASFRDFAAFVKDVL